MTSLTTPETTNDEINVNVTTVTLETENQNEEEEKDEPLSEEEIANLIESKKEEIKNLDEKLADATTNEDKAALETAKLALQQEIYELQAQPGIVTKCVTGCMNCVIDNTNRYLAWNDASTSPIIQCFITVEMVNMKYEERQIVDIIRTELPLKFNYQWWHQEKRIQKVISKLVEKNNLDPDRLKWDTLQLKLAPSSSLEEPINNTEDANENENSVVEVKANDSETEQKESDENKTETVETKEDENKKDYQWQEVKTLSFYNETSEDEENQKKFTLDDGQLQELVAFYFKKSKFSRNPILCHLVCCLSFLPYPFHYQHYYQAHFKIDSKPQFIVHTDGEKQLITEKDN